MRSLLTKVKTKLNLSLFQKIYQTLKFSFYRSLFVSLFLHAFIFLILKLSFLDPLSNLIEVTILHSHPQNQTPRSNEIAMDLSIKTDPKISEDHSAHEIRDKEFLKTAKKQPKSEETTTSKPQKDPLKTAAKNETLKDPIPEVPQTGYTDLTQAQNVDAKDLKSLYLTKIRNKIAQNQIYPKASLVFKEQGTVEIKLSIKKDGSILKIELQKASQFNHLNDAALQAVANSSPFEAIPESLNYKDWVLLLPIKFKIE